MLSITSLPTKTSKKIFSYSYLSPFLALLWIPTSFSKSQPVTSTSISWRICKCTLLQSLVEIDKSSLILKSQNIKGLWKAFWIISEGKNNTTERQHDFYSLSEKRGCLFLLLVKLHGVQKNRGLAGWQKNQKTPDSLPLLVLEGRSCPSENTDMQSSREEYPYHMKKSRPQIPANWRSIKSWFCWLSVIIWHYLHNFTERRWFAVQLIYVQNN